VVGSLRLFRPTSGSIAQPLGAAAIRDGTGRGLLRQAALASDASHLFLAPRRLVQPRGFWETEGVWCREVA
jgi:hypothetical protein